MEILIRVFKDGDMWCALVGKDIMEGIAGFSETLTGAVRNLADAIEEEPSSRSIEKLEA